MQRNKGFMKLLGLCMYICMYGQLSAISQIPQSIATASSIYKCNPATSPGLLASIVARQKGLSASVKLAASRVVNCEESSGCSTLSIKGDGTLSIKGDISITESKNVAITNSSLTDITVSGTVTIYIPTGGSFTINGTVYTTSPIEGLAIAQNSQFSCENNAGVFIDFGTTLNVQGNVEISDNTAISSGNKNNVYGVQSDGSIIATGNIEINNNAATSSGNNGNVYGVQSRGSIIASGNIKMNNNTATSTSISNSFSIFGASIRDTIQASGDITMNNNQATNSNTEGAANYGVLIDIDGKTVKVGGNFIIGVTTTDLPENTNQNFNSNPTAITDLSASATALSFNQFTITIDEDQYGSTGGNYGAMQEDHDDVVILNSANRS